MTEYRRILLEGAPVLTERHGVRTGMTVLDVGPATADIPSLRPARSGRPVTSTRSTSNHG